MRALRFLLAPALCAALIALFVGAPLPSAAQSTKVCYPYDFNERTGDLIPSGECFTQAHLPTGTWYAAIAKSKSTRSWGASWHVASEAAARSEALRRCSKAGHRDCRVAIVGWNDCLSLAEDVNGAWAVAASDDDRNDAVHAAVRSCRKYGGTTCVVQISPCARSEPSTPQCIQQYTVDISRGEAWKSMSPEERAVYTHAGNGNCPARS